MNEIVAAETQPLSVQQIKANIQTIQQVMAGVMKNGTHFGTIPGCGDKPALLKPGAEKILATFRISANPTVEDLSGADEIRYRVKAEGQTPNGLTVGFGIGECSTSEEKYKWRSVNCNAEWDETAEDRRRTKYNRKGETTRQIRTNPSDLANTVLKMAKKRALVDLCLTATAASDCFTQDLDDMDEDTQAQVTGEKPPVQQPQRKTEPAKAKDDGLAFDGELPTFAKKPDVSQCELATGELVDVDHKTGAGDKGPWERFGCKIGKVFYGTFDKTIGNMALDMVGSKVKIYYKKSGKFNNLEWIEVDADP